MITRRTPSRFKDDEVTGSKNLRGALPSRGRIVAEVTLSRAALWVNTRPYPWSTFIRRRGLSLMGHIRLGRWLTYDDMDRNRIAGWFAMRGGAFLCSTAKPHRGRRRLGYRGPSAAPPMDFCCTKADEVFDDLLESMCKIAQEFLKQLIVVYIGS